MRRVPAIMRRASLEWKGAALVLALAVLLTAPAPAAAQSAIGELHQRCAAGAGEELSSLCLQSALATHTLHGGLGLLVAAGGSHPVSPSTAGRRMEARPRIVVDGGLSLASVNHLDLSRAEAGPRETRSTFVAGRLTAAAGIFDGFSLAPTVGGVGSLDGVLTLRVVRLPGSDGFSGTAASVGAGVRLGVFRESFSLPGVTLTAIHHRPGTIRYGDLEETGRRMVLEPRVTSARLEVGKDMLAMGVIAGAGLDRMSGRARIGARTGTQEGAAGPVSLTQTRRYLFAGLNYTWLVTQVSGELAWSPGRGVGEDVEVPAGIRTDAGGLQAALTFRVTY